MLFFFFFFTKNPSTCKHLISPPQRESLSYYIVFSVSSCNIELPVLHQSPVCLCSMKSRGMNYTVLLFGLCTYPGCEFEEIFCCYSRTYSRLRDVNFILDPPLTASQSDDVARTPGRLLIQEEF